MGALAIVEDERIRLEKAIEKMLLRIREVRIADKTQLPLGWRKSAKGRTVWRIIEEVISQNLEIHAQAIGLRSVSAATSEVGVYDFCVDVGTGNKSFVNIKSAVSGARNSKDDVSKADKLLTHFKDYPDSTLYIATFHLRFTDSPGVQIEKCTVIPVSWIPDIYVNPSNNGNLQSSNTKNLKQAVPRTNEEFIELLRLEMEVAAQKRARKLSLMK